MLHFVPIDVDRATSSTMFPEVDYLLSFVAIEGEIIVIAPAHQILYLVPVLYLIIVCDLTHYGGVISTLENRVGGEFGHIIIGV